MKIATWNVNSVKARIESARAWIAEAKPDVVCLQEIKCTNETFPAEVFEGLGYNCLVHGQKSYNGVAILSKRPLEEVRRGLPESEGDDHARYAEAIVQGDSGVVRIVSVYAPNGNPPGTDRFAYKLSWHERLRRHVTTLLQHEEPLVVGGDYNIIPTPLDCHDPKAWAGDALFQPESRAEYRKLTNAGFIDAFRACHGAEKAFTFWDYFAGSWTRDRGIRIDHLMLSPQAADRLTGSGIDRHVRSWERPSDHVPVWCELTI
jgi:exodeoxyribonuclease III